MHVAQDANMKLNNRARRRGMADAPFQPGSAYMVDPAPFNAFIKDYVKEKEVTSFSLLNLQLSELILL
jgi:hypothetical protein